jgi:hypothetical protein
MATKTKAVALQLAELKQRVGNAAMDAATKQRTAQMQAERDGDDYHAGRLAAFREVLRILEEQGR